MNSPSSLSSLLAEEKKPALPFSLKEKIASLEAALLSQNPGFSSILAEIHKETKDNPEFVYGLSDEEICIIVQGFGKYTGVSIETKKEKKEKQKALLLDEDSV